MLEVTDLHVYYGQIHALKGISFRVGQGEIVTLLGNNGAGKTTTLRTLSGLLAPRQGDVRFEGASLLGIAAHDVVLKGITHVPEGRRIFNRLSVVENLEMGAYTRADASVRRDIEAMLERFPMLGTKRREPAGTLSGGQQQILEIAIALLLHPRVLLIDEPSLGLDPRMVEIVFSTIVTVNRAGTAVLMVEQNAKQALAISHRGFVLELGRNRFEGTGRALLENPDVRAHYLGG